MMKNQRPDGVWNAVVYLRLSKEDRDKKDESNSIRNQRDLALDFVSRNADVRVAHILTDDGATGANFDRGAFQAMIEHIERGDVNCVVVKDFSRFSREHVGALKYIQRYFVSKNVRFIAINDAYDGLTADMNDTNTSLLLPFKTIINEAMLEDISTKTKTQLAIKRKNGELVCNYAAYGYIKVDGAGDTGNGGNGRRGGKRLEVDAYAAEVVRGIFDKKLDGCSDAQIAGALNAKGILSPAEYKKSSGIAYNTPFATGEKSLWTANAVKRVLTNRVYVGVLEQGKRAKTSYRTAKCFYKPRDAWSVHTDDHEPIISQADFDLVQELMAMDTRVSTRTGRLHMFSGFVVCGGCGEPMIVRTARKEGLRGGAARSYAYFICATHKKHGGCRHNNISGALIERSALASIRGHIAGLAAEIGADGDGGAFGADTLQTRKKAAIEGMIERQMAVIRDNTEFVVKTYAHFLSGEITEDYYKMFTAAFNAKVADAERNIDNLRRDMARIGDDARTRALIERFQAEGNITALNRRMVAGLIERVVVGEDKEIHIRFRYDSGVGEAGGAFDGERGAMPQAVSERAVV